MASCFSIFAVDLFGTWNACFTAKAKTQLLQETLAAFKIEDVSPGSLPQSESSERRLVDELYNVLQGTELEGLADIIINIEHIYLIKGSLWILVRTESVLSKQQLSELQQGLKKVVKTLKRTAPLFAFAKEPKRIPLHAVPSRILNLAALAGQMSSLELETFDRPSSKMSKGTTPISESPHVQDDLVEASCQPEQEESPKQVSQGNFDEYLKSTGIGYLEKVHQTVEHEEGTTQERTMQKGESKLTPKCLRLKASALLAEMKAIFPQTHLNILEHGVEKTQGWLSGTEGLRIVAEKVMAELEWKNAALSEYIHPIYKMVSRARCEWCEDDMRIFRAVLFLIHSNVNESNQHKFYTIKQELDMLPFLHGEWKSLCEPRRLLQKTMNFICPDSPERGSSHLVLSIKCLGLLKPGNFFHFLGCSFESQMDPQVEVRAKNISRDRASESKCICRLESKR